jgi:hypothetical protein
MTIMLKPDVENRLQEAARREGIEPSEYVNKLLDQTLPQPNPNQSTIDLLNKWEAEDQTDDPEEIARREQEGEEFMRSLAQSRIDMEGPNARKLWP